MEQSYKDEVIRRGNKMIATIRESKDGKLIGHYENEYLKSTDTVTIDGVCSKSEYKKDGRIEEDKTPLMWEEFDVEMLAETIFELEDSGYLFGDVKLKDWVSND